MTIERLRIAMREARAPGGLLSLPPARPMNFRRDLAALVLLTLAAAAFYLFGLRDALFSGDVTTLLARGDSHRINWAKAYILDARLRNGEFPLWDTTQLGGEPYAAHPLAMAFYPPNLLRAAIVRASTAEEFVYSMYALLFAHLLMGMYATYLFARGEGVSITSSFIASLALGFCERWIVNGVYQTQEISTAAWLPVNLLVLRHAHRVLDTRRRAAWVVIAGVLYGLQILAGWPQSAIYSTIAYVAYIALMTIPKYVRRRAIWRGVARSAAAIVLTSALFGIIGALTALALILPAREFLNESSRSLSNFRHYETFAMVNKPTSYLASLHAEQAPPGSFNAARVYTRWAQSFLCLPLALTVVSLTSLFLITHYRVFVVLAIAYLLFDLTFGPPMPLAWLIDEFAPFSISTPWYQVALLAPMLAVLAAFALDKVIELGRRGTLPDPLLVLLTAAGVVAVVLGRDPARHLALWTAPEALFIGVLIALVLFGRRLRHWPALVRLALCVEILRCANVSAHVTTEVEGFFTQKYYGAIDVITERPDDTVRRPRMVCGFCNEHVWAMESAINGFDPLVLQSALQTLSTPGTERAYARGAYTFGNLRELTLLRRHFWLAPAFVQGEVPPKAEAFPPSSVVFLDTADGVDLLQLDAASTMRGVVAAASSEEELWVPANPFRPVDKELLRVDLWDLPGSLRNRALRVYYRTTAERAEFDLKATGPRSTESFETGSVASVPDENGAGVIELPLPGFEELDVHVTLVDFDPEVFSTIDRVALVEDDGDEIDRIEIREAGVNRMVLALRDLPGARALVFAETHYPGWVATLDGAPTRIFEANGRYQAVVVPPGSHEVVFEFRPWRVYVGVIVSVTTVVLSATAALVLFMRGRARPVPAV